MKDKRRAALRILVMITAQYHLPNRSRSPKRLIIITEIHKYPVKDTTPDDWAVFLGPVFHAATFGERGYACNFILALLLRLVRFLSRNQGNPK